MGIFDFEPKSSKITKICDSKALRLEEDDEAFPSIILLDQ